MGLAADAKHAGVTDEIQPIVFRPHRQSAELANASFYVRSAEPLADLMNAVRETVTRVEPVVPITNLRTMQEQIRENTAPERFVAGASSAFAVLATVLAGLGLYGVLAYSVAQRSREIGLRFALGAPVSRIRRAIVQRVAMMTLAGSALGIVAAWLLGRAAQSLLFGLEAGDSLALVSAAVVLTAVTLGAACVPAWRASRVDPMSLLWYE